MRSVLFRHARPALAAGCAAILVALALTDDTPRAQGRAGSLLERFQQQSVASEQKGLAAPFVGITTSGTADKGLFALASTGVSTEPVRRAAEAFLGALGPEDRRKTQFPVDDPEWRKWMNQHFYQRQGMSFERMTQAQRDAAFGLLRASLSAKGLTLTRDIMRLNHTLAELNNNDFEQYGEWYYYVTLMGTPSATEPWGWQLDGHHAVVNYFVMGDQVVMSPVFVGSEPVRASSGKYAGTVVLQDVQDRGLAFMTSLDAGQRAKATIEAVKTRSNNQTEAFRDNQVIPYAGIRAAELTGAQKEQLLALAALHIGTLRDGHAKIKMEEVRRHLDETRFAWIGGTDPASTFYYRIHSPVVLIEFDHATPTNLRHLAANPTAPTREHIHVVIRTPNGNDYGKDLLRLHYLQHPHS
jgi:hypothetical protein